MTRMHNELGAIIEQERKRHADAVVAYTNSQREWEIALSEIVKVQGDNRRLRQDVETARAEARSARQELEKLRTQLERKKAQNQALRQDAVVRNEGRDLPAGEEAHRANKESVDEAIRTQYAQQLATERANAAKELEVEKAAREIAERKLRDLRTVCYLLAIILLFNY